MSAFEELTPEQRRMARQAGAAFTPDSEEQELLGEHEQLALDTLGPQPGELYLNTHTGEIGCVVTAATRRKSWVKVRRSGHITEIPLHWLGVHWKPCRPDGTLK